MTSYGKHGSQRNQLLPTQRAIFNYANVDTISGYNSFFSGATDGGDIVPENTLVLTNDNSVLQFGEGFYSGLDALYGWNLAFNTAGTYAYVAESRNASAADGSNLVGPFDPTFARLPIQINSASTASHIYALESKNYLKLKRSGRTFVEGQGIFRHAGSTNNTFSYGIVAKSAVGVTTIPQASWNIDTFGAGTLNPSQITLDFQKNQTPAFEFYDKSIGGIRFGFLVNNTIYYAHWLPTNNDPDDVPLSQRLKFGNLNLPIRDEVEVTASSVIRRFGVFNDNTGIYFYSNMDKTIDPALIVTQYLNSVVAYSVGGSQKERRLPFVAGTRDAYVTVSAADTPIFSIKADAMLSGNTNRTVFNFDSIDIHSKGANLDDGVYVDVIYNGLLTADTFTNTPNSNSGLVYDTDATAISGGTIIYSGVIYANQVKKIKKSDLDMEYINAFSRKSITLAAGATPTTVTKDDILTVVASPFPAVTNFSAGAIMVGGEVE